MMDKEYIDPKAVETKLMRYDDVFAIGSHPQRVQRAMRLAIRLAGLTGETVESIGERAARHFFTEVAAAAMVTGA